MYVYTRVCVCVCICALHAFMFMLCMLSFITTCCLQSNMAAALGFYNWGVYIGYSLAFAFNFIVQKLSWRWAFWIAAIPGLLMGVLLIVTVREPKRKEVRVTRGFRVSGSFANKQSTVLLYRG